MLELNKAYHMDFFDAVAKEEFDLVDMCVTSPPYYNARKYGKDWDYFKTPEDWLEFCFDMLLVTSMCVKPDGVIWWNTGSGYKDSRRLSVIEHLIVRAEKEGIYMVDQIPWCKTSFIPKLYQNRPYPAWEQNIIFSRAPEDVIYYVDHVREPYAESTLERLKYPVGNMQADEKGEFTERKMVNPNPLGKSVPNYLHKNVDTSRRDHPAPMANGIANWAIRAYTVKGETVLDPMCGYGTTLIEANKLERNAIGFDINERYVEETNKCLKSIT